MSAIRLLGCLSALLASSASAVGLGPLRIDGKTAGERKGFYLTLVNPYPVAERFRLTAIGWDDESVQDRIRITVPEAIVAGGGQRRLLVVASGLQPGEIMNFRVCAERAAKPNEEIIHARVCSKLTARRLG